MTDKIKVSTRAWRMIKLALSRSPAPLCRATRAVAPTFMAWNMVIIKNFGCVVKPTEVMAQAPSCPTIIRSTMEASCVSISSIKEGQAMCRMSLYIALDVTPSGSFSLVFLATTKWLSSPGGTKSSAMRGPNEASLC